MVFMFRLVKSRNDRIDRQAATPTFFRHASQLPQRILQPHQQALERFGETQGTRLPVRTLIILFPNRKISAVKLTDLVPAQHLATPTLLILCSTDDRFRLQNPRTLLNLTVPTAALEGLSAQYEMEQQRQAAQSESLRQQVARFAEQMTRLAEDYRTLAATLCERRI